MSFRDLRRISGIEDLVKRLSEELARERYGRKGELLYILNVYRTSEDSCIASDDSSTNIAGDEYRYDSTNHDFGSYS